MRLTNHDLGLNYEDFKDTFSLNDGGVTDNLGLEVLLELKATGHDLGTGSSFATLSARCATNQETVHSRIRRHSPSL